MRQDANEHDAAMVLARIAHHGQVDKIGRPVYDHLVRVASRVVSSNERTVAFLHDIVEDTEVTIKDLHTLGFSMLTINAVSILTRHTDESYLHNGYIPRIIESRNPWALMVKIADIEDHLDGGLTFKDHKSLVERYSKAIVWLRTEKDRIGL